MESSPSLMLYAHMMYEWKSNMLLMKNVKLLGPLLFTYLLSTYKLGKEEEKKKKNQTFNHLNT